MTTAAALAATAAGSMYLDAKHAIRKDLRDIMRARDFMKMYTEASVYQYPTLTLLPTTNLHEAKNKRNSLYYFWEESVNLRGNDECIWSREGCYTWTQANEKVNQYAQWYLSQGVRPHDLVSFYLSNSPDFVFAWLGLWAIGAAPAMINFNLAGKALMHCLKVAGAKLIMVDDQLELAGRIEEAREDIECELGARICVMDDNTKRNIASHRAQRPGDEYRRDVTGSSPMSIFYTRYVYSLPPFHTTNESSGTTGMPKGVPFNHDRGFILGSLVGPQDE